MKTVRQPRHIRRLLRLGLGQMGRHLGQRAAGDRLDCCHNQAVYLPNPAQNALCCANICDRHIWANVRARNTILTLGQFGQNICARENLAFTQNKCRQIRNASADLQASALRCGQRINPHQSDPRKITFNHRRDKPACTAQGNIVVHIHDLPVFGHDLSKSGRIRCACGGRIAGARLGVNGLNARPKRRTQRKPRNQRKQLQRVAPPMTDQRGKNSASHAMRPFVRFNRRGIRAANRCEWVTKTKPARVSATNSHKRANTPSAAASSKLPVGSSARTNFGWAAKVRAIATRCCCPPDKASGYLAK